MWRARAGPSGHGWSALGTGWGGGYRDRTLAVLSPRPVAIGIALLAAQLLTNYPQPHDVPLEMIVTEMDVAAEQKELT